MITNIPGHGLGLWSELQCWSASEFRVIDQRTDNSAPQQRWQMADTKNRNGGVQRGTEERKDNLEAKGEGRQCWEPHKSHPAWITLAAVLSWHLLVFLVEISAKGDGEQGGERGFEINCRGCVHPLCTAWTAEWAHRGWPLTLSPLSLSLLGGYYHMEQRHQERHLQHHASWWSWEEGRIKS